MKKWFVLLTLLLVSGCNLLEWPAYVLFGQESRTVDAEYEGLGEGRTAILAVGQPGIDFEHPYGRLDLALATQAQIRRNLPDVTFIDQEQVERFVQTDVDFLSLSMAEIAERLGVQRVIYIELLEFSMREPESINLLRGHIWAQVSVFESQGPRPDEPVYETEIEVLYPENAPAPASDEARNTVWQTTVSRFADQLARKFYRHKESTRNR